MMANDLKIPFTWEERRPHIGDQFFYVPSFFSAYGQFPPLVWDELLPPHRPLMLEYCCGNGQWIVEKALSMPDRNWIGVDKQFDRVRKLWRRGKKENLPNLFSVCSDAFVFTDYYLLSSTIDEIFINFPDPWPKKRHHKHRLIQPPFLEKMARVLKENGKITFVTDDLEYREWTVFHFLQSKEFISVFPDPFFVVDLPSYGTSFFDSLWREKGKTIFYLQFKKVGPL